MRSGQQVLIIKGVLSGQRGYIRIDRGSYALIEVPGWIAALDADYYVVEQPANE